MTSLKHLSTQDRVQFLKDKLSNGRMASVEFFKADGSVRNMTVKNWAEKALSSGDRNIVQANTTDHKLDIVTVFSTKDNGYRKFSVDRLVKFVYCGEEYTF